MKKPKSRRVLRNALISALTLSVISATAIFVGESFPEIIPFSASAHSSVSKSDMSVVSPTTVVDPSEENRSTKDSTNAQSPDSVENVEGETVNDRTSNDLDEVVPTVVRRRILASSVYFATNYDTSFGGEIDSELSREFYNKFVDEFVTHRSDAASFAFTPTKIDGSFVTSDKEQAEAGFNGSQIKARQEAIQSELSQAFNSAAAAFWNDYPEAYWVGSLGYSYSPTGSLATYSNGDATFTADLLAGFTISMTKKYDSARNDANELTTYDEGVASAVNAIKDKLNADSSRYDTVKAIHDYICNNADYDEPALTSGDGAAHTVAPFFIHHKETDTFVCEGYAKAFKILCNQFNIPCVLVSGDGVNPQGGGEPHMWNYVQMGDGKWYGVDATWDDQSSVVYNYFLCGANSDGFNNMKFKDDHKPSGVLSTSSDAQEFVYPALSAEAYDPNSQQDDPSTSEPDPSTSETDPSTSETDPSTSETDPSTSETDPSTSETDPSTSETDPSTSETDPSTSETDPSTSETDPSTSETDPSTSETDPSTSETDPSTSETDPSTSETDPDASETTADETTTTTAAPDDSKLTVEGSGFVSGAEITDGAMFSDADGNPVAVSDVKIVVSLISGSGKSSLFKKIASFDNSFDKDTKNAVAYDISLVDNNGRTVKISGGKIKFCLYYPKVDAGMKNVKYTLYHQSGNSIEKKSIACKSDGIWSETDGFSPYVLAYSAGTDSPGTGESNLPIMVAACLGMMALLTAVCVFEKKRRAVQK